MRNIRPSILSLVIVAILVLPAFSQGLLPSEARSQSESAPAKNVILFIGDGMGPAHRLAGQLATVGVDGLLVMDSLPVEGLSETAPDDPETIVTDSAAGA